MHGDRVVVRVEHARDAIAPRGASSGSSSAGPSASSAGTTSTTRASDSSCRSTAGCMMDVQVPQGETRGAAPGEMVTVADHALADADAPGARPRHRGARPARRAGRRHRRHHPQVQPAGRAQRRRRLPKRSGSARVVRERDVAGRTDFRDWPTVTIDGEHARDFDDAISIDRLPNGNFWLGRAHRRRRALRDRGQRARRGGLRARHVRVLSRARRAHVSVGAVDRTVQPQPARRSARAVVPDGGGSPHGRGRAVRDARRRHPQPRADDLHGGERDPDRSRSGGRSSATSRSCRCSSGCTSCSRSSTRAGAAAARSTSICKESEIVLDDAGHGRGDRRGRAQRRAPAHRGVHAARQRDGRRAPRAAQRADALSRPRGARSGEGRDVRGVHLDAGLFADRRGRTSSRRATSSGSSRRFTASRRRSRSRS